MPRKSDSQHENRGNNGQKGDRGQMGGKMGGKMDDFRQQGRQDVSGKMDELRQQARQDRPANLNDSQQQNQQQVPADLGGLRNLLRANRQPIQGTGGLGEGAKKNGCLPKLFMLVLPLMALGTFLLLRS